jgi:hypothetical protein
LLQAGLCPLAHRQTAARRPLRPPQRAGPPRPAAAHLRGLWPGLPRRDRGANLIKIHRRSGKLSYLVYPDFDDDPHPALLRCVRLSLRTRQLDCYDYAGADNPPILHRKETFLHPDHPLHARFSRLTQQEERHGLLADPAGIGTRARWQDRLREAGFALRGHRLVRACGDRPPDAENPSAYYPAKKANHG